MNWYKQKKLLLVLAGSIWSSLPFYVAADSLNQNAIKCAGINAAYQEVYSFETENYYINVCQQDHKIFYHRQSKVAGGINILVPASTVPRSNVYQAKVGRTTYFAGKDSDRYYSSVMLNNNEIVFEPEIETVVATDVATKNPAPNAAIAAGYQTETSRESNRSTLKSEFICAGDKSAFHPELDGWRQLIGESIVSVNKYAVSNGHEFVYNRQNPDSALIATQKGEDINLRVAANTQIVERVCIQSDSKDGTSTVDK